MKSIYIRLAFCAVVFALLWMPLINSATGWITLAPLDEQRVLSAKPELPRTLREVANFGERYAHYYRDHFEFRELLIRINNLLLLPIDGADFPGAITRGKDGWLFFNPDKYIGDNEKAVSNRAKKEISSILSRDHWLRTHGIDYYQIIVPNKGSIYPEKLPDRYRKANLTELKDRVANGVKETLQGRYFDLVPSLTAARERGLFYPGDFHWNFRGAQIATVAIARHFGMDESLIPPAPEKIIRPSGGEFYKMISLDMFFPGWPHPEVPSRGAQKITDIHFNHHKDGIQLWRHDRSDLPRILVFHDSFGEMIRPYLAHLGSEVKFFWSPAVDRAEIELFNPDIVIQLVLENGLTTYNQVAFINEQSFKEISVSPRYHEYVMASRASEAIFEISARSPLVDGSYVLIEQDGEIRDSITLGPNPVTRKVSLPGRNDSDESRLRFIYQLPSPEESAWPFALNVETGGADPSHCVIGFNGGVLYREKGYNIYHITSSGRLGRRYHFNTSWFRKESNIMARLLAQLEKRSGYLLIVSTFDGARNATPRLERQFADLGSSVTLTGKGNRFHIFLKNLDTGTVLADHFSRKEMVTLQSDNYSQGAGFKLKNLQIGWKD